MRRGVERLAIHIASRTNAILAGARLSNADNAPCATRTGMGRLPPSSSVVDHRGPICYPCSRQTPPLRLDSGNDYRPYHRRNRDRKSTRLNSSHGYISYAVFCLKKKKKDEKLQAL